MTLLNLQRHFFNQGLLPNFCRKSELPVLMVSLLTHLEYSVVAKKLCKLLLNMHPWASLSQSFHKSLRKFPDVLGYFLYLYHQYLHQEASLKPTTVHTSQIRAEFLCRQGQSHRQCHQKEFYLLEPGADQLVETRTSRNPIMRHMPTKCNIHQKLLESLLYQ